MKPMAVLIDGDHHRHVGSVLIQDFGGRQHRTAVQGVALLGRGLVGEHRRVAHGRGQSRKREPSCSPGPEQHQHVGGAGIEAEERTYASARSAAAPAP